MLRVANYINQHFKLKKFVLFNSRIIDVARTISWHGRKITAAQQYNPASKQTFKVVSAYINLV